jgi:hypothetical protein
MAQHALSLNDLLTAASSLAAADFERFVSDLLALRAQRGAPRLSSAETQLLLRINRGLPPDLRARYDALRAKLLASTLGEDEHAELLRLTAELERLQVERIAALTELSQLRGQKLGALMDELGIRGPADGGTSN